jgi:hypothetical protein
VSVEDRSARDELIAIMQMDGLWRDDYDAVVAEILAAGWRPAPEKTPEPVWGTGGSFEIRYVDIEPGTYEYHSGLADAP